MRVAPAQRDFVSSVAESLQQAEMYGGGWPRLILDDGEAVAFVMGGFGDQDPFKSGVWKLLVDEKHQRKGYGTFAVGVVAEEARRRGQDSLSVFFHPGPEGPEGFWLRCGFTKTGMYADGAETHAVKPLT